MADRLSLRQLNRTSLQRQGLVERLEGSVLEVVGRLAGLQAQHANSPYVALWSRREEQTIAELEAALVDRTVVKATLMRATLHLVPADDFTLYDVATSDPSGWEPTARKGGLDLAEMNARVRRFCDQPRSVTEIEEFLATAFPPDRYLEHVPAGVRNPGFRMAMARGGLVHVPPSGLWKNHDKPRYLDRAVWLGDPPAPEFAEALTEIVERYLRSYGPVTERDILKWAGLRRVTDVRRAVGDLGDRVARRIGPDGLEMFDLADVEAPDDDVPVPTRFLSRWDSLLISYADRDRILPPEFKEAVIKKNGDFLPTFLVDGFVAGLWSVEVAGVEAILHLEPLAKLAKGARTVVEEEAGSLVRYLEPEAGRHSVAWLD